jgi:hypothetical protein
MASLVLQMIVIGVVGRLVEVGLGLGMLVKLSSVQGRVVHIVVLDTVAGLAFHIVEQLIVFVLHCALKILTIMILHIMSVVFSMVIMSSQRSVMVESSGVAKLKIALIGVLWHVTVFIMVHIVSSRVMLPVIRRVLNSMSVMVLIHMLGVMVTLILIRVIVTHVVSALWLDVVILAVLLTREVSFVAKMGLMVLQIPVTLGKVRVRVLLDAMCQDFLSAVLSGVIDLVGSRLTVDEISHEVLFGLGVGWLGRSGLSLLLVVHLFVEEGGFGAHVLFSLSRGLGRLRMVIGVVVIRIVEIMVLRDGVVEA